MKDPESIRSGGYDYKIRWIPKISDHLDTNGSISDQDKVIVVDSESFPGETLIHELTHCLENQMAVDLGESWVRRIENMIVALVRDNPGLLTWMDEKINGKISTRGKRVQKGK